MSVFSRNVHEDRYLVLQSCKRMEGNYCFMFSSSFPPMSWHVSQDFMLNSHLFSCCCSQSLPRRITHHWYSLFQKERKLRQSSSHLGCRQESFYRQFPQVHLKQDLSSQSPELGQPGPLSAPRAEERIQCGETVPWAWGQQDTAPTPLGAAEHSDTWPALMEK